MVVDATEEHTTAANRLVNPTTAGFAVCAAYVGVVWQGKILYGLKSGFETDRLVQNGANAPYTR